MNAVRGALARHPVLFNSVVGYSVFVSGDVMAQRLDVMSEAGASAEWKWDYRRSLSIGLLGIVQNGFLLRIWYRTLDKFVTPKVWWCVVRDVGRDRRGRVVLAMLEFDLWRHCVLMECRVLMLVLTCHD